MGGQTDINISVSNIFSNSHFKKLIANPEYPLLEEKLNKYSSVFGRNFSNRKEALDTLYEYLLSNYRCEYIYKHFITKNILLGRHSLNTSNLINEFRVGSSLADIILINGTSTVYEIKTELDSPDRLWSQIEDYQKAFTQIYLITHHSQKEKYLDIIGDTAIGLKVLTKRHHLSIKKESDINKEHLDITTMFKCLRKAEYSNILKKYFEYIPDVPNMFYHRECLKLAKKIGPPTFNELMNDELSKRKPRKKEILSSGKLPPYLSNICLSIDPNEDEYRQLFKYLNEKFF